MTDDEIKAAAAHHAAAMASPGYEPADLEDQRLHGIARKHVRPGHVATMLTKLRAHLVKQYSLDELSGMTADDPRVAAFCEGYAREHATAALPSPKPTLASLAARQDARTREGRS